MLSIAGCGTADNALLPDLQGSVAPLRAPEVTSNAPPQKPRIAAAGTDAGRATILEGTGRFVGSPSRTRADEKAPSGGDAVTLNLVNVPTRQAAKAILGDVMAVKYTVDPAVKGEITVQTPEPVTKAAAMGLFQAALRGNGAALVQTGGIYRIVPADQALIGAPLEVEGKKGEKDKFGSGVHIVQLKYVSASDMQRILEPIVPRGSIVRADDTRHILMLNGSPQEVAGIRDAIDVFDVDIMKGMSFALVPVKSSQPTVIANELRMVFATGREGPTAGMVHFLPNNRLRAILVISPQRQYLARAEAWVRRLDARAEGTEKQFFTYLVQNRRAQDLVAALQAMFASESGRGGANTRNVAPAYEEASVQSPPSEQPIQASQAAFGGGSFPQRSQPRQSPNAGQRSGPGGVAVGTDEATGEPRIRLAADSAKNALLVEATPSDYRRVMKMVAALDVMPNQVLIEATIAEVTLNDELRMGVRSFLQARNARLTFSDAASGAVASVFPGFSYALALADLGVALNALNEVTDVKIVSSPSLTVMDNSTAVLQIGDQVPITTQTATSVLGGGAPIVNSVSYRDTGVILTITPRINESGRVLLDIEQEVSSVVSTTTSGIDSPTIRQRRVRTTVVVSNGEPLTLGGLIQESRSVDRTQMPIIGDLPLLGNAFKQKDNKLGKTELIIIIVPRVMRNLDEARLVTEEYRREFERRVLIGRDHLKRIESGARRVFE